MKIISLELYGYKRLRLTQTKRFKITLNQVIQLILGTNGSGKSSIMEEMGPLPANSNSYTKDGYKIIELTNNNHHYILTSKFNPKQEHSFIKNGIELNDGGTVTVQKELVKQELGITTDIHELLIGVEKFHLMSPSRKREWFTQLGESNYDYSLKVFSKLREKYRDTQGAIKLAKKRLVIETAKLLNEAEEKQYRDEVQEIHRVMTVLLENRDPSLRKANEISHEYNETESKLLNISNQLLSLKIIRPKNYFVNSDIDLEFDIRNLEQSISNIEIVIKSKLHDFDLLEKTQTIMTKTGGAGLKELEKRIKPLTDQQKAIRRVQQLGITFQDPESVLSIIDTIDPILYDLLSDLPENKDRKYSRLSLDNEIQFQNKKQDEKKRLENDYARFNGQKLHLEHHKKEGAIECPKCTHKWIRGYSEEDYQKILVILTDFEKKIEDIVKEIRTSEERVSFINDYARKYRDYLRVVDTTKVLAPFWEIIENQNKITDAPRDILNMLSMLRVDLGREIEFNALAKEISDINELAKSMQDTEANNLDEINKKILIAQEELSTLTSSLNTQKTTLTEYQQYRSQLKTCFAYNEEIKKLYNQVDQLRDMKIEVLRNNGINYCIQQLQSALATKEKLLSESNVQKGIVNDLKEQICKLEDDEEAYKILISNLSPTDGLIAEGLFGFIRSFVKQMNLIIKKTWSYPLEVVACGMNEDGGVELDYRFPLIVQTKDNVMPDVSKGSSGMKEVVDLAFRIIATIHLGLGRVPIYLDEWGKTLDVQHKKSSVEALKALMEQQSFSQLFLISHDFLQYSSLSNAEVCVLDSTNVITPPVYNEHVIIE